MRPKQPPHDACPQAQQRELCNLQCKYNHFENDELSIESYELKCLDCGYRQTIAYRSDDSDAPDVDPMQCPFCQLNNLAPGHNPCG